MKQIIALNVSVMLIFADQLSKWFMVEKIILPGLFEKAPASFWNWMSSSPNYAQSLIPFFSTEVTSFLNIVMVWNKGVSFGLFSNDSDYGPLILSTLSLCIVIGFVIWMFRTQDVFKISVISLVIAGALGNVIDRVRFGAVIDFIDVHAFGYHWPAFNLADSLIVIGIGLLIIYSLFFEKETKQEK